MKAHALHKKAPQLSLWQKAVRKAGGYKKGEFKPLKGKVLDDARKEYSKLKRAVVHKSK